MSIYMGLSAPLRLEEFLEEDLFLRDVRAETWHFMPQDAEKCETRYG